MIIIGSVWLYLFITLPNPITISYRCHKTKYEPSIKWLGGVPYVDFEPCVNGFFNGVSDAKCPTHTHIQIQIEREKLLYVQIEIEIEIEKLLEKDKLLYVQK